MKRGYFGIGIERGKTKFNFGSLFRTAQIFEADFIFMISPRFRTQGSETCKSWRSIPTYNYESIEDFNNHRPYSCLVVGIELLKESKPIINYCHPKQVIYLLGAEDHGLSNEAKKICQEFIQIPGEMSLNVSVAGSIVIYDRILKQNREEI